MADLSGVTVNAAELRVTAWSGSAASRQPVLRLTASELDARPVASLPQIVTARTPLELVLPAGTPLTAVPHCTPGELPPARAELGIMYPDDQSVAHGGFWTSLTVTGRAKGQASVACDVAQDMVKRLRPTLSYADSSGRQVDGYRLVVDFDSVGGRLAIVAG